MALGDNAKLEAVSQFEDLVSPAHASGAPAVILRHPERGSLDVWSATTRSRPTLADSEQHRRGAETDHRQRPEIEQHCQESTNALDCAPDCDVDCDLTSPNGAGLWLLMGVDGDRVVDRKSFMGWIFIAVGHSQWIARAATVNRRVVGSNPT